MNDVLALVDSLKNQVAILPAGCKLALQLHNHKVIQEAEDAFLCWGKDKLSLQNGEVALNALTSIISNSLLSMGFSKVPFAGDSLEFGALREQFTHCAQTWIHCEEHLSTLQPLWAKWVQELCRQDPVSEVDKSWMEMADHEQQLFVYRLDMGTESESLVLTMQSAEGESKMHCYHRVGDERAKQVSETRFGEVLERFALRQDVNEFMRQQHALEDVLALPEMSLREAGSAGKAPVA